MPPCDITPYVDKTINGLGNNNYNEMYKNMQQAHLKSVSEKFESYFKGLQSPAIVSNNTFRIVAFSSLFRDAFGHPSQSRNNLVDYIDKKDKAIFFNTYSKWLPPHEETPFLFQCTMSLKSGIKKNCQITVRPIENEKVFLVTFKNALTYNRSPIQENTFLQGMQEIFFRIDIKGIVQEISPSVLDILEYKSLDDIIGSKFFKKASTRAKTLENTDVWKTLKNNGGEIQNYELPLPHAAGGTTLSESNLRFYYDEHLKIAGIEGHATDVTANRTLISELRRALNFTNALLQSIPTPLMYKDKKLVFQGCNQAFTELTGFSQEEIQNKKAAGIWSAEFAVISEQKENEAIKSNLLQIFEGHIKNKAGKEIIIIMVSACYPGADGKPAGVISSFLDITARKAIELAIKKQEEDIWKENRSLKKIVNPHLRKSVMVGNSPAVMKLYDQIHQAARTNMPVLIEGESGTGKELVAQQIHRNSNRADKPIVAVNCSAIPTHLTESVFFGHIKGAFTGALEDNVGYIRAADGSTLFLDEINSIPMEKQAKLLRALESGEVIPVGGNIPVRSNFRLISASNQEMKGLIETGKMRVDFYYRLKVLDIKVPPLRERKEDIPMLTYHFLTQYKQEYTNAKSYSSTKKFITKTLFQELNKYDFPGNIRELKNKLYQFFTTGELSLTPPKKKAPPAHSTQVSNPESVEIDYDEEASLADVVQTVEKEYILILLDKYKYNRSRVAKHLKITRKTLYNKMKAHGIES